ncbi:phosphoglycerate mutase [Citricoccus zhacaiensis]|uniref:Phosphoglycerate mutase n=1 Tax=Citricoccus zhacaiensis TaxID=489142 RepID=A0ABQ2LX44_9MICC|nr:histidine phosphatase family protein [Citricoccus zhacaiensis]GGO44269.1 phosphoglycerate mutase [Citricoccus zhacaiensis]
MPADAATPDRIDTSGDKTLILLRHAKSDWPDGVNDHDRPLGGRGNREAPAAGQWLAGQGLYPDMILCSDAVRTRQTCTWVCSELGEKAPTPYLDSRLYEADATRALAVINETEERVRTLMVIGHMPWVQDLGMRIASVDSDEEAVVSMAERYPTLGLQVFKVPGEWASLDGRDARMTHFVVPRP